MYVKVFPYNTLWETAYTTETQKIWNILQGILMVLKCF
jgi:hypothetical protein